MRDARTYTPFLHPLYLFLWLGFPPAADTPRPRRYGLDLRRPPYATRFPLTSHTTLPPHHTQEHSPTQPPTSPPAPLPWGEGSMLHKKTHQNPQKGSTSTTPQASPPPELRKGRAASPRGPFAIRGVWGDFVPPQKKTKALSFFATSAAHFGKWAAVATVPACTDVFLGQAADFSHVMVYQISHCKRDDKPDDEDVFIHSEPHGEWRIYHGMWTIYKCGQYI